MKLDVHDNLIIDPTSHTPYHTPGDTTHLNQQKLSNVAKRKSLSDLG